MKKTLFLFVFLLCSFISYSQNYEVKETLIFHGIKNLNANGDVEKELDGKGIIVFCIVEGENIIRINIGSKELYTIKYSEPKETKTIGDSKIESYFGGMFLEGRVIPIRVNKIFNIRKNKDLPEEIQVLIFHTKTHKMVSGQSFYGLIKGKNI